MRYSQCVKAVTAMTWVTYVTYSIFQDLILYIHNLYAKLHGPICFCTPRVASLVAEYGLIGFHATPEAASLTNAIFMTYAYPSKVRGHGYISLCRYLTFKIPLYDSNLRNTVAHLSIFQWMSRKRYKRYKTICSLWKSDNRPYSARTRPNTACLSLFHKLQEVCPFLFSLLCSFPDRMVSMQTTRYSVCAM